MSVFTAIDFETSGPQSHCACAVGLVRIENGVVVGSFQSLIRPPSSYVMFTHVHGLTWPMLRGAPGFRDVWPHMRALMEGCDGLVAHNAAFDRGVLRGCIEHFSCGGDVPPFYCTLKGARRQLHLPSSSLDAVCRHWSIPLNHHNALSDAQACAAIFVRLTDAGLPVEEMRLGPPKKPRAAGRA